MPPTTTVAQRGNSLLPTTTIARPGRDRDLARGTRTWITPEAPLGTSWAMEYAMFCLGTNLATAGGLATQYAIGRAHSDFENLVVRSQRPVRPAKVLRRNYETRKL